MINKLLVLIVLPTTIYCAKCTPCFNVNNSEEDMYESITSHFDTKLSILKSKEEENLKILEDIRKYKKEILVSSIVKSELDKKNIELNSENIINIKKINKLKSLNESI